jgi:hypothetical protein
MRVALPCGAHLIPLVASVALILSGCGGGASDVPNEGATAQLADDAGKRAILGARTASIGDDQRITAAKATAGSKANECAPIAPFYWEVGNSDGSLVSGSITSLNSAVQYTAAAPIKVASASKWLYGAYVAERTQGGPSESDRKFLSMRSGYVSMGVCARWQSVGACLLKGTNGDYTPEADGSFDYDGGHLQKHAQTIGLGKLDNPGLAAEIRLELGNDIRLEYSQPQIAGGAIASPESYALFLRKLLDGRLQLGGLLGTGPVCTNPRTCETGISSPTPPGESWHYSFAHWIEDDPLVGDGAFSSPGVNGFYPWIDSTKTYYGIVARDARNSSVASIRCGRLIRKAWATGTPQ